MELQTCQTKYNFDLLYVLRLIILGMMLISAGSLLIYFRLKKYINILSNEMRSLKNENSQLKKDLGDVIFYLTTHNDLDPAQFSSYIFGNNKYLQVDCLDIDFVDSLPPNKQCSFAHCNSVSLPTNYLKKTNISVDELTTLDLTKHIFDESILKKLIPEKYLKYVKNIKLPKKGYCYRSNEPNEIYITSLSAKNCQVKDKECDITFEVVV